ncbi:ATP-grasp domain-containing protein [Desulfosporosinus lacus]|uniref:Ribosomal protein S6--L-glutamate ligase n=1 Tax=Desulfosporosinus lacus DSM 15449 TaxID=1121420 RepID=A0A1M6A195_9FIRM|nr:RimK family alpha-L-glutamate ligase [Desulfosporosinus lacus]SHI29933.1 ribosomal protein S6--L-glutamate ligase [Desulfosporosinus lacus DSM 15449]
MRQRFRIGIMGTAKGPHIQALAKALQNTGAEVILVPPQRLTSFIPEPATIITGSDGYRENLRELDALLVRSLPGGSLEQVIYRVDVLHRLEKLGLKVINRAVVLEKTVDKFYTSALLGDAGLPVPRTVVTESFEQAMEGVKKMGRVVVKPLFGSLGTGMVLVEDQEVAYRVFRALELGRYVYYLQEFLPHNNEDYRLFVVGGEVISTMRRRGETWKTNIACGAVAEYVEPDPVLSRLALKTAELLGADYLGVDILISNGQPYIIEANGIPGWTGLQSVTPVKIADVLADYTVRQLQSGINKD